MNQENKTLSLALPSKGVTITIIEYLKEKWYRYKDVLEEPYKPKTKQQLLTTLISLKFFCKILGVIAILV